MQLDKADKFLVLYIPISTIILYFLGMQLATPKVVISGYHALDPWQIPAVIFLFTIVFLAELLFFLYLKRKK